MIGRRGGYSERQSSMPTSVVRRGQDGDGSDAVIKPSEYERRRLAEIEAALRASDPGLDRALRTFRPRRAGWLVCLMAGWLVAVAAGLIGWWIVTLIALGPLLTLTCITLGARWRVSTWAATDGMHSPTWTRFWG